MGDVLAYEAELLGLVREVGFLSFFSFFLFFSSYSEPGFVTGLNSGVVYLAKCLLHAEIVLTLRFKGFDVH